MLKSKIILWSQYKFADEYQIFTMFVELVYRRRFYLI